MNLNHDFFQVSKLDEDKKRSLPKLEEFFPRSPVIQMQTSRGGVEDTRLEAKAKDTKKIRGQGQPFRGQTLSRPKTKDTGASVLQKNIFFRQSPKKKIVPKKFLLVLELHSRSFYVQAYVNDLAVLVTGADMLWIRGMPRKQ